MSTVFTSESKIEDVKEFKTFTKEIDYLIEFFNGFSELIFLNGRMISFMTPNKIYFLNTSLIESAEQTLRSIKFCCTIGSFSDANTLVRKLRDDLIQYVYILTVINNRKPFIEEDLKDFKTDNPEEVEKSLSNIRFNDKMTDDEEAIFAWFKNTVSELKRPIKRKLEFENYMKVLKQNSNISQILNDYKLKGYWEVLRKRLNNYVHNNGVHFSMQNSVKSHNTNLKVHLENVITRTSYISSFFIIAILMIDSALISSTDYMDHLNCDMEPPEDSQYLVASFMQDFIDEKVNILHPELKQYLKDNNINGMKIE